MSVVDLVITNPSHAEEHPIVEVDFSIGVDVGFKLNKETGTYELYADRQTWNKNIPIERFMEKLTQQYARKKKKKQKSGFVCKRLEVEQRLDLCYKFFYNVSVNNSKQ